MPTADTLFCLVSCFGVFVLFCVVSVLAV